MKNFILAIFIIALVSCKESKTIDYALFSGKIENQNSKTITILNSSKEKLKEIEVSEDGTFSDTILNVNGYYSFSDGKESTALYLKNGFNLNLKMDAKEFDESIVYIGEGNEVNNFLAQKYLIIERLGSPMDLYAFNENEFLSKMDSSKMEIENNLKGLDPDFVASENIAIKYKHLSDLSMFENYHRYISKNKDFKVSNSFPDLLKNETFDNEEYFKISEEYKRLTLGRFFKKSNEKSKVDSITRQEASLILVKDVKSELIKEEMLKTMANNVSVRNPEMDELYEGIMAISTNEKFKTNLTEKYEKISKLAKGSISPKFVGYENFKGGTTSLDDLKGKFVYVDVWATWCGPCKREIPFLKEVEGKYHNKNIEFVSISVDKSKDHDAWQKMVKEKELGGIQLFADKDWNSSFVQDYAITGIPRFILIDKEGNIVSSNAPRPSSPKLIELLNELDI